MLLLLPHKGKARAVFPAGMHIRALVQLGMWGTQSTRTKRQCKGPHPTPFSGQAGWKSTGEKICRHVYKVDPSSSWAEVLRLPSSCPWIPVSLSAGPWTSKPPRQQPCCSCWSAHGLDTISWTGAPWSHICPLCSHRGSCPRDLLALWPPGPHPTTSCFCLALAGDHALTHAPMPRQRCCSSGGLQWGFP